MLVRSNISGVTSSTSSRTMVKSRRKAARYHALRAWVAYEVLKIQLPVFRVVKFVCHFAKDVSNLLKTTSSLLVVFDSAVDARCYFLVYDLVPVFILDHAVCSKGGNQNDDPFDPNALSTASGLPCHVACSSFFPKVFFKWRRAHVKFSMHAVSALRIAPKSFTNSSSNGGLGVVQVIW